MKLLSLYRNNRPEFFRVIRYLLVGAWNTSILYAKNIREQLLADGWIGQIVDFF